MPYAVLTASAPTSFIEAMAPAASAVTLVVTISMEQPTEPAYRGALLEPIVAASYTKHTGNRVRRINAVPQHPAIPLMLANIDRGVVGARDVFILECKTAGEFGSRECRDGVSEYVQLQVQHQLAVTGKQAADVAVLLRGQKLKGARDNALIARQSERISAAGRWLAGSSDLGMRDEG